MAKNQMIITGNTSNIPSLAETTEYEDTTLIEQPTHVSYPVDVHSYERLVIRPTVSARLGDGEQLEDTNNYERLRQRVNMRLPRFFYLM